MQFQEIHGLSEIKEHLINGVKNNHVAHAQMFIGKEGSAALPMALAYASYLNCENPTDTDSCGTCPSCSKIAKHVHPDVHYVFPVSATQKIAAKDAISKSFLPEWRNFLLTNPFGNLTSWSGVYGGENKQAAISRQESREIVSQLALKAFEGKHKIMIIWLPELMHPNAANGILKILEEPSEGTIFLLVALNEERILTTIRSRTQATRIPSFNDDELAHILQTNHQVEEPKAKQLAHMADGNLLAAVELMNDVEDDSHGMFRDWMRLCYQHDFSALADWSENFSRLNKVAQKSLLIYGLSMMREALMAGESASELIKVGGEEEKFALNFGKVLNHNRISLIAESINNAHYHLERNANPKILFMDLSIDIARSFKS